MSLVGSILALVAELEEVRNEKFDMQKHECFTIVLDNKTFDATELELAGLMTKENGKLKGLGITIDKKVDKDTEPT